MAQSFNTGLNQIASGYARLLRAKITASGIKKAIEENPYYPSLLSLSDTFDRYNIPNSAYEVGKENFSELVPPFVAFANMPGAGKDFVLVTAMQNGSVSYLHKKQKAETIGKAEFLKRYQDVVWMAEPGEQSGESGYAVKLQEEGKARTKKFAWQAALVLLALIALAVNISPKGYIGFSAIALLKLAGLAVCGMILMYENGKSNAFVKNLCSAGGHANCDAVLGSRAAKINGISWGEIGFFYFASTTLWLLQPSINFAEKVLVIGLLNAFASLYIPFSIYYQWKVVKQWCPLCLTVQAILFLELVWSMINFWPANPSILFSFDRQIPGVLRLAFCAMLPCVAWYGIKPLLAKSKDADLYSSAYKRLQYNPEIFNALLQQQPKAPDGWQHLGISIGNPSASNTIIKVCNPYCRPCAMMHHVLEEIISNNMNVQLKIIFITENNEYDKGALVVKHLLSIS
ncbi:MAG: vitamin K epoxide reductase family protein, partial [Bacteroidetes bacterium]|nr:vitamin K epoxide reductase family protein [Bacteroidota bacterium]